MELGIHFRTYHIKTNIFLDVNSEVKIYQKYRDSDMVSYKIHMGYL